MENTKLRYLLLFVLFAGFASCKSDATEDAPAPAPAPQVAPAPLPVALFSQNKKLTERHEPVTFINHSQHATRYEWDFGRGITSTMASPSINFYDPGVYNVQLKAYNADNMVSVAHGTVTVGQKYITRVVIERLDPISAYNYPWDPQDGPDLYIRMAPSDTPNWIYSPVRYNVTAADLPVSWDFSPSVVVAPSSTWTFELYDEDLPFAGDNIMGPRIQTHSSTYTTKTDSGTKGYFSYEQREAKMKVYFEIK